MAEVNWSSKQTFGIGYHTFHDTYKQWQCGKYAVMAVLTVFCGPFRYQKCKRLPCIHSPTPLGLICRWFRHLATHSACVPISLHYCASTSLYLTHLKNTRQLFKFLKYMFRHVSACRNMSFKNLKSCLVFFKCVILLLLPRSYGCLYIYVTMSQVSLFPPGIYIICKGLTSKYCFCVLN